MRIAEERDVPALKAFLERHLETSMFLLGNLEAHGRDGDHIHATRYFVCDAGAEIAGVFGVTRCGFVMCQMPQMSVEMAQEFANALYSYLIRGMIGAAEQVAIVLDALPIATDAWQYNDMQPLCVLECASLPPGNDTLRVAVEEDRDWLKLWFTALSIETGLVAGEAARIDRRNRATAAIGFPGSCR